MKGLLVLTFLFSSSVFARDFDGTYKVTYSNCKICKNLTCEPINCLTSEIKFEYLAANSLQPETMCISEINPTEMNRKCYFNFNVGSELGFHHEGILDIQDDIINYTERKEDYPVRDSIRWKIESLTPRNFEFTQTTQHSDPVSNIRSETENRVYRLSIF